MSTSRVKQRWDVGEPVICTTVHTTDPTVCELVSAMGFDCIWIDLEHHATSVSQAAAMTRAARVGGADVLARPAKGEYMRAGRLLEFGAHGIMYPRCDSAAEAAEVVRWLKFAPQGERGFDGMSQGMLYPSTTMAEYVERANDQTFLLIQIESPQAADLAAEIAAVDGVDALMFGIGDFSVLSGHPGQFDHPEILQAREKVCRAALDQGKRFASIATSPDDVDALKDMGSTFICYRGDYHFLKSGFGQLRNELESKGFSFDDPGRG